MDIAAVATGMSAVETSYKASVSVMKGAMDSMEEIAAMLTSQLMNLNVGMVEPSQLDMYV